MNESVTIDWAGDMAENQSAHSVMRLFAIGASIRIVQEDDGRIRRFTVREFLTHLEEKARNCSSVPISSR